MGDIIAEINEIKKEFSKKQNLKKELEELNQLLFSNLVEPLHKSIVKKRIIEIERQLNIDIDLRYSIEDIENAQPTEMLIKSLLPRGGIVPLIGGYGSGKSTFVRYIINKLLEENKSVYIRYIDLDNPTNKLQEFGIHEMMKQWDSRFEYLGKRSSSDEINETEEYEKIMRQVIDEQIENSHHIYVVVQDNLKNLYRKNKQGFVDTKYLYRLEKRFQAAGGTIIPLHHTNKAGVFADTKDIVNFADVAFYVKFNEATHSIVLEPDKQSRYKIDAKAFKVDPETREISHEIEYQVANIPVSEIKIVEEVVSLLQDCGSFNQSELETETRQLRSNLTIGQKRFRAILKKYIDKKWSVERGDNNSLIYSSLKNVAPNLPNCQTTGTRDFQLPNGKNMNIDIRKLSKGE